MNGHYQVDEFHVVKFVKARSEIKGFMSGFGLSEEYFSTKLFPFVVSPL